MPGTQNELDRRRTACGAVTRAPDCRSRRRVDELGSLSTELSDRDEDARIDLDAHLTSWISLLADALERMRANGALRPEADTQALATGIMAALQGGHVLAQAARDPGPMEIALELAMASVQAQASRPHAMINPAETDTSGRTRSDI